MTTSDWTAIAIMCAGLIGGPLVADLSVSMFGRRVKSNLVRRLRGDGPDGMSARSFGSATLSLIIVVSSQLVPIAGILEGQRPERSPLFIVGLAEIIALVVIVIMVGRGTTPDYS